MKLIQQITKDPRQQQTIILDDGSRVKLVMYFRPMQYGWFFDSIEYGDFVLNGTRIMTSPNILNQYRNIIPFGFGCYTSDNNEPTQIQDFYSGYAKLYLLTEAECAQYGEYLRGQS